MSYAFLLMWKVNSKKKYGSSYGEKFPSLVLPWNAIMSQHLFIQFPPDNLSSGHLQEVKNKTEKISNFQLIKWSQSLTRGSNYSEFTWKLFVFWKIGRCGEAVATGSLTVQNSRGCRSLSSDYGELGHFTLLFCRGRQRNVPRFITHARSCCSAH